ncbi:unnamed protein product [Prunus armeniaca]
MLQLGAEVYPISSRLPPRLTHCHRRSSSMNSIFYPKHRCRPISTLSLLGLSHRSPKGEDGDRKQEYYKYKIVEIIIPKNPGADSSFQFNLQMFCSETGKWTKAVASSPQSFSVDRLTYNAGVAFNGMLPVEQFATFFGFLGVCRGSLRIFQMFTNQDVRSGDTGFSIWEFKDDGHQVDCDKWCLVDRFYIRQMIKKDPLIAKWDHQTKWRKTIMVLGLDPNKEDVLYMELCQHLVMYNIRTRTTLKKVTVSPYKGIICPGKRVFPSVIP